MKQELCKWCETWEKTAGDLVLTLDHGPRMRWDLCSYCIRSFLDFLLAGPGRPTRAPSPPPPPPSPPEEKSQGGATSPAYVALCLRGAVAEAVEDCGDHSAGCLEAFDKALDLLGLGGVAHWEPWLGQESHNEAKD